MIRWQSDLVRSLVPKHHLITTCIAANQPGQDVTVIGEPLDVAAVNIYYASQAGLELPGTEHLDPGGAPSWIGWSGPAYVQLLADIARGMKQAPFLVTETNATTIGSSADELVAWPGQLRQVVYLLLARGARLIEYWHWHTNRFGAETWWEGILGHNLQPGRIYRELGAVGGELAEHRDVLVGLQPLSQVGLIVSAESRWGVEAQPPFQGGSESGGDKLAYEKSLATVYRGLFDAGLQTDVLSPAQLHKACDGDPARLVARWPVLIGISLYIISDADLDFLRHYVESGGHLVWTPRSGMADEEGIVRADVMPGAMRDAAGVRYEESTSLLQPVPVMGGLGGHAQWYAHCVIPEGAETIAGYDHPFLADYAAVTTHPYGKGQVTVLGCFADRALSGALARWVAAESLPVDSWRAALGATQSHVACRTGDGRTLHLIHNWSWQPSRYVLPASVTALGIDTTLSSDQPIELGAWDVQILLENGETR
jgi:beta-galactosidase